MFNYDILNCVFKRDILKLLFFFFFKNANFPIASQLVLALVFRLSLLDLCDTSCIYTYALK